MKIILIYDIDTTDQETNPNKRLRKILNISRQYLNQIQKSVFEGNLTQGELFKLKNEILKVVDKEKDSVIIYLLNDGVDLKRNILTNIKDPYDNFL
ncbi:MULTISPECIES: CRISPR-associated endonuclease Cas2 [Petrotoga]|uniref:CRISPR-associated endoribonuclease Cas2 n=2 Tax=Petrotoga sibirica TaxID=156202 RepID=A0A4R8EUH3_9BACT|nr:MULTISPECIES: CRISPR-associated endonuclease Cas2 [Petrotoga]POZ89434.1 CRISPR-associated protein Cas2 [Petrotoga sibirica DSM 13575]POZ91876.1 CRISPR-associated protein Cas2 [Petrotoga sp. SL27]TDX16234.1 CRISPR-associated Cas2 family protein [Petrotoga sibirica]